MNCSAGKILSRQRADSLYASVPRASRHPGGWVDRAKSVLARSICSYRDGVGKFLFTALGRQGPPRDARVRHRTPAPFLALLHFVPTLSILFRGASITPSMEAQPMSNIERIIRLKTVLARTGLSRTTLYRKMGEGTFPRQVKISIHGAGWHESAINRWIADPMAYRADSAE